MTHILPTLLAALLLACNAELAAAPSAPSEDALTKALAGAHRSEANRARDAHRHPKETLLFFGLQPQMHVVEVTPGGGWYTEVLAPVLRGGAQDREKFVAIGESDRMTLKFVKP